MTELAPVSAGCLGKVEERKGDRGRGPQKGAGPPVRMCMWGAIWRRGIWDKLGSESQIMGSPESRATETTVNL